MDKDLREFKRMIEAMGLRIVDITQNRHIKVTLENAKGTRRVFVMSASSSDWRAQRNARRDIARMFMQEEKA